ncbi:pyridoxal phosphate-dependent decarboxylase family protein [Flagellimonas sp. 2504JD4-2]
MNNYISYISDIHYIMSFIQNSSIITEALKAFIETSLAGEGQVINQHPLNEVIEQLNLNNLAQQGGLQGEVLERFITNYLALHTRLHHPGYLGHQCAPPHYAASLAAMVNAFTNNVPAVYEMGPASATIEHFMINWMLKHVGWTPIPNRKTDITTHGGGVFVNGGSIANLTALVIARSSAVPTIWETGHTPELALLLPSECHYSLTKAAGVVGFGKASIFFVEVDQNGAIKPDRLVQTLNKVKSAGKQPVALVANACSTSVGIYDPLDEIADFCEANKLWMHVDGAHGASALISNTHKHLLKGVARADSLLWDAHKLLQTPSLCAALLVKQHKNLYHGIHVGDNASYLFHEKNQLGYDSLKWTLETTKSGLGEKLFFVLASIGEKGLVDYIDSRYELTLKIHSYLNGLPDFECPVVPQSNILCFKYQGDDQLQIEIRKQLLKKGDFYLTSTLFNGVRYLRLVFMSQQTAFSDIERLVASIRVIAKKEKVL